MRSSPYSSISAKIDNRSSHRTRSKEGSSSMTPADEALDLEPRPPNREDFNHQTPEVDQQQTSLNGNMKRTEA
ncbi:hypothetical protein NC653_031890 [Populus alba x Populus x berolinensis]|uniref:Uncharacterized protein n=2 Tax=Populus alba x Populus x berolinensis TaxID=444605 RepID=A0AAD6LY51_9ROSI|nr:hypothetical protein NC653_030073 [Populus alba x Populus x berolinensis]KAJ6976179.1 hypothetical protein NC653_031883 [Populus alba x Populus x berolinensis]KAJ6976186.1 hypothetical protein NC653_031890 [Populus alba x Populus x berolinensis]